MSTTITRNVSVRRSDGSPPPHTAVIRATPSARATLKGTTVEGGAETLHADTAGHVMLEASDEDQVLVVTCDHGIGLAISRDLEQQPDIVIRPWARIEGTWNNRGRPLAGQVLRAGFVVPQIRDALGAGAETKTDAQGQFVFEHIAPAPLMLSERHEHREGPWFRRVIFAHPKPGQTEQVEIVTQGRQLHGHLELIGGFTCEVNESGTCLSDFKSCYGAFSPAARYEQAHQLTLPQEVDTLEKREQWWSTYYQSPLGRQRLAILGQVNILNLQPDGSFTADLVAPGKYRFDRYLMHGSKIIALFDRTAFIVPEASDEPLDIGKVLLKRPVTLSVGDPAPKFDLKMLDGGPVALSDFSGRFVLLNFTATWCGYCDAELPYLKKIQVAFGEDPRFALLSINLDSDQQKLAEFIHAHEISWPQVFLDEPDRDALTAAYGVHGVPAIFLVDPAGKVAASELRGQKIRDVVAKALASR